jgi:hypothetical protein
VALLESEGNSQIIVVVDHFSKMAHFIVLQEMVTAKDVEQAFLIAVEKLHGLPKLIVSERETKWICEFWEGLCNQLGIRKKMLRSFHPQTDGQTEKVNQTLETDL